jgi:hypothetical protein
MQNDATIAASKLNPKKQTVSYFQLPVLVTHPQPINPETYRKLDGSPLNFTQPSRACWIFELKQGTGTAFEPIE